MSITPATPTQVRAGDYLIGTAVVDLTMLALGLVEVHGWYHLHDNLLRVRGQVLLSAQVLSNPMTDVDGSMHSENDVAASSFFAPPSHILPMEGNQNKTSSEKTYEEDGEDRDTEENSEEGGQTLEEGLRDLLSGVQRQVQSAVDAAGHLTDDAGGGDDDGQRDSSEEIQPDNDEHENENDRGDDHKVLEETSNTSMDEPQDHRLVIFVEL